MDGIKVETDPIKPLDKETAIKIMDLLNRKGLGCGVLRNFVYVGKTRPALVSCEKAIENKKEELAVLVAIQSILRAEVDGVADGVVDSTGKTIDTTDESPFQHLIE